MINQEEYEILKKCDDEFKWVARDKNRKLWAYTKKPDKGVHSWGRVVNVDFLPRHSKDLFQFIQWEDEEPHEIAGLIREYEIKELRLAPSGTVIVDSFDESEETEVKDKKWAQKEVDRYLSYEGVNEARDALVFAKGVINQLDEPEVLSQELPVIPEYIVELITRAFDLGTISKTIEALTGMTIEQVAEKIIDGKLVPEQELPVIPKFVAEWMEENSTGRCAWWKKIAEWEDEVPAKDRKVYDWYTQSNEDTFILAWITRHYEVEEEPLYYVYLGDGHYLVSEDELREPYAKIRHLEYSGFLNHVTRFTEQEIKDYDERFWAFAVPVEEVEGQNGTSFNG